MTIDKSSSSPTPISSDTDDCVVAFNECCHVEGVTQMRQEESIMLPQQQEDEPYMMRITDNEDDTSRRRNLNRPRRRSSSSAACSLLGGICVLAASSQPHLMVEGFAGPTPFHKYVQVQREPHKIQNPSHHRSSLNMYVRPDAPTSQTAPMVAKAIFSSQNSSNANPNNRSNKSSANGTTSNGFPLSNSVLSSSDTLPSFPTAHGLLSPETVLRMEEMNAAAEFGGTMRNHAVDYFLKTYRTHVPMACFPLLSYTVVLPSLPAALRYVIA
jgi:hypothetical protein